MQKCCRGQLRRVRHRRTRRLRAGFRCRRATRRRQERRTFDTNTKHTHARNRQTISLQEVDTAEDIRQTKKIETWASGYPGWSANLGGLMSFTSAISSDLTSALIIHVLLPHDLRLW